MTRSMRLVAALLMLFGLTAARDPILVPEVSQHDIILNSSFTGTELLLFGAILNPDGTRAGRDYDIAVVLKGPARAVRLREKQRVAGIWINADSSDFRSVPSYFAIATSRPLDTIVDKRTAAIYELGLDYMQLSPVGAIEPEEQRRFGAGLVDLRTRQGHYVQNEGSVTINEQVLYQARIALPSSVEPGIYTAETFAISNKRVVAAAVAKVEIRKTGFERFVEVAAERQALLYGLAAVALSLFMGWAAGRLYSAI